MTRQLNTPAVQAEVAADYNGLPHARIIDHQDHADVFTSGLRELELWFLALGGHFTVQPAPADSGVVLWTLLTDTDHGHGTPIRAYAMARDTDQLDPDCTAAIRPHAA